MAKSIQSFDELKRSIYLYIVPGIFIATMATLILQIIEKDYTFQFYANIIFVTVFFLGWFVIYRRRLLKVFEYVTLSFVIMHQLVMLTTDIMDSVGASSERTLDSYVIWTPLIIFFIFMVMKKNTALLVSALMLFLSLIPGLLMYTELTAQFVDSLFQLYMSTAVYTIIVFFAYELFRVNAEVDVMRKQLYLDSLTQIGNRYQIDKWMSVFIEKATVAESFSILFFDVDQFKLVNDRFGHKVGDDVLKECVAVVKREMKSNSFFGRWGGEEFIVLLPIPEREAYRVADRLRQVIEQHHFEKVGQVTVSFGVASYQQGDTVDTILMRADERLYVSKEAGRNRVTGKMIHQNDD